MNGEATLRCEVSLGMFSHERSVAIQLQDGRRIAAFVDKRDVKVDREPAPDQKLPGRVRVSIVEDRGDSVVVDLPQPAVTEGTRVTVPKTLLEE
ncbi:MAG: hypothetical protein HY691_01665 [Chloroflexi bacterium]|nr:hypothetical protein [Chloroflexota bacterium]